MNPRLRTLFRIGWFKSLYINFRLLPFKQAIHMPIVTLKNTHIESLSGKMILNCPASFGLVKLGFLHTDLICWREGRIYLNIDGTIEINGWIQFGVGTKLIVDKGASLSFGENTCIGSNSRIICREKITIGPRFRTAWDVQIMDTNFHYVKDISTGKVNKRTAPIVLGANNWIGNRSSVMKGTHTNNYFILASNSMVNRDYTQTVPPFSLMVGSPAKLLRGNVCRVLDKEEREISKLFEGANQTSLFVDPNPKM